jgi:hypothetical protein
MDLKIKTMPTQGMSWFHCLDIEYVPKCPYLEVTLDRRMSWKPHVEVLSGKAHGLSKFCHNY